MKRLLLPIGIAIALIAYLGPNFYRNYQMDKEVDRLCSMDGGIRIFEQVKLSKIYFDEFGNPIISNSINKKVGPSEYFLEASTKRIVPGDPRGVGSPTLLRSVGKAIRLSDGKVLGEAVGYSRFGGVPDGPWQPTSYVGCISEPAKSVSQKVFEKL